MLGQNELKNFDTALLWLGNLNDLKGNIQLLFLKGGKLKDNFILQQMLWPSSPQPVMRRTLTAAVPGALLGWICYSRCRFTSSFCLWDLKSAGAADQ